MVLIIKPISAQLVTDKDMFGKSVILCPNSGSLRCRHDRQLKAKN